MLPETSFFKRSEGMFVVANGRYYSTLNSGKANDSFLSVAGLSFPLIPEQTVEEEIKNYLKRHKKEIEKRKSEFESKLNRNHKYEELVSQMEFQKNLAFFLSRIAAPHNFQIPLIEYTPREFNSDSQENSTPSYPFENCAVINRRVFPLERASSFLGFSIDGNFYSAGPSRMDVAQAQTAFFNSLDGILERRALAESMKANELRTELGKIKDHNMHLISNFKVNSLPYCFEVGNLGFDFVNNRVYHLIESHYNQNRGKSYSEEQSAISFDFANQQIGGNRNFMDRENRNNQFNVIPDSTCYGDLPLPDNSPEGKMKFLLDFADMIERQGKYNTAGLTNNE